MVTKYHFLRVMFSRAFIIDDIKTLMISQFVNHSVDLWLIAGSPAASRRLSIINPSQN